jgi:hypothetical protein
MGDHRYITFLPDFLYQLEKKEKIEKLLQPTVGYSEKVAAAAAETHHFIF